MKITIDALEAYLAHCYKGAGDDHGLFMKLVEEVGEIAEVLNKRTGRKKSDGTDPTEQLGLELADLVHYAVAIAAVNGIDLERVILEKDRRAAVKYHHDVDLESFIQRGVKESASK